MDVRTFSRPVSGAGQLDADYLFGVGPLVRDLVLFVHELLQLELQLLDFLHIPALPIRYSRRTCDVFVCVPFSRICQLVLYVKGVAVFDAMIVHSKKEARSLWASTCDGQHSVRSKQCFGAVTRRDKIWPRKHPTRPSRAHCACRKSVPCQLHVVCGTVRSS